jgi:membrane-associated phospholipid phosphatase
MKDDPRRAPHRLHATLVLSFIFAASLCASAQTAKRADAELATTEPATAEHTTASPATTTQPLTTQPASETPTASPTPQTTPTTTPQKVSTPRTSPSLEREFVKNVLCDQRAIWTSPFRLTRGDARWLLPLGLSSAALVASDRHTAGAIDNDDHLSLSHHVSLIGSTYGVGGIAAAFYLAGRASHNARARETGLLGGEALIDGGIVSFSLKSITQRPRPRADGGRGDFFDGGNSFPSGHSTAAWSLATVVAEEYHERRSVRFAAYGLATAVSLARYTGRNHFLSDVLVGSAIGYGVGRYVYHAHHDAALDAGDDEASVRERSKLLPRIAPEYNRSARVYGVALAWSF